MEAGELVAHVEATAGPLFAWSCRIAGGAVATTVLPVVYERVGAAGRRDGSPLPDRLQLQAIALALLRDRSETPESVTDRALLDLSVVAGRSDGDVAAVLGLLESEVAAAVAVAHQRFEAVHGTAAVDDILHGDEMWLDDELRARCVRAATDAAGGPAGAWSVARSSGRRTTLGIVATIAVIVGVVAWTTRSNSTGSAVLSLPTDVVSSSTTDGLDHPIMLQPPGYVLPPGALAELTATGSEFPGPDDASPTSTGWLSVWAEPTATHTAGRWVSAVSSRCGGNLSPLLPGSTRVRTGDRDALLTRERDDVLQIIVAPGTTSATATGLELTAHGFSADEVESLAAAAQLDIVPANPGDPPPPNCGPLANGDGLHFGAESAALLGSMDLVVARPAVGPRAVDQLEPTTYRSTMYGVPGRADASLTITARRLDRTLVRLEQILLESPDDPTAPVSPVRTVELGDRTVIVSQVPDTGSAPEDIVQFDDGSSSVTVRGSITPDMPLETLIKVAGLARQATPDEWEAITSHPFDDATVEPVETEPPPTTDDEGGTVTTEPFTIREVDSSQQTDGKTWALLVAGSTIFQLYSSNGDGGTAGPIEITADAPVLRLDSPSSTVLVIGLVDPGDATSIRVTVGGTVLPYEPLARPDPAGPAFAVVSFTADGPIAIDVIDHDGGVVRTLDA
ncbi:MAG: hypothetical protein JWM34_168 [Ilumatobacteraceae bacterium]|nr:hypothetical protein [Ilumatobacteraceae bacterium]